MKKFTLEDYVTTSKGCSYIKACNKLNQTLKCVCDRDDGQGYKCFKCGSYTHRCIEKQNNRGNRFQCASCLSQAMDPLYTVRKVLVESYFQTKNIFEFYNQINFEFIVTSQQLCHPIQIRGLKAGQIFLSWPMQGALYLNQQKQPFFQLKPLLVNSSRKTRKQQFIAVPRQKIRPGKNYIRFKILVLRRAFTELYQCQEKGIYFMSINSINVISKDILINETFQKRRLQKQGSLSLLQDVMGGVQIVKEKMDLICPYTKEKIKYPVRGRYCRHFGCACLQTIIAFHNAKRQWICPHCDNKVNQPYIDLFVYEILKDKSRSTSVYIEKNGNYQWAEEDDQAVNLDESDQQKPVYKQKQFEARLEQALTMRNKNSDLFQVQQVNQLRIINNSIEPESQQLREVEQIAIVQQRQPETSAKASKDVPADLSLGKPASNLLFESLKNEIIKMANLSKQKQTPQQNAPQKNRKQYKSSMTKPMPSVQRVNNMIARSQQLQHSSAKQKLFDIAELRSRDHTKQFMRRQLNLPQKIEQQKAIAMFFKQNPQIKNLFTQVLQ